MAKKPASNTPSLIGRLAAELGIIVLGVLIALWADGWVSDRQDRDKEAARLAALRDNVVATMAGVAAARETAEFVSGELRTVAYWTDLDDLDTKQLETLLAGYLFGPEFTPEINVYDDLENSGELALLTSDTLRQALARMRTELDGLQAAHADLLTVQQLNFDPFVVEHLATSRIAGLLTDLEGLPVDEQPALPEIRIVRNLAMFKLDLLRELLRDYASAEAALRRVLEEIDAQAS